MSTSHVVGEIVFAGGGTGGHLFPGLAVAHALTRILDVPSPANDDGSDGTGGGSRESEPPYGPPRRGAAGHAVPAVTFAGTDSEFERRHVAAAGFDYLALDCRPLLRGPAGFAQFAVAHWRGYRDASRFLRQRDVAAVVGLGGFASVPMAMAAVAAGIPLIVLEQNAVPGKANRWLARSATFVCSTFSEARWPASIGTRLRMTGTPIRVGFAPTDQRATLSIHGMPPYRLFVLGGSRGASELNRGVPPALARLRAELQGWEIVHQAGESEADTTRAAYQRLGVRAEVVPFLEDFPWAIRGAGMAICRAGGSTLADLAAAGVPAVLCPYPHAADDHQRRNAAALADVGAALVADTPLDAHGDRLARLVAPVITSIDRRREMSRAMVRWSRPRAAYDVARLIVDLLGVGRSRRAA